MTLPFERLDSTSVERASRRLAQLGRSPEDRAEALVLRMALYYAGSDGAALPRPEEVSALLTERSPVQADLGWVCARGVLAAALDRDRDAARGWSDCLRRQRGPAYRATVAQGWLALLEGRSAPATLMDASREARGAADASAVVEANVVSALDALSRGRGDEARRVARRASRIARTESLPQSEFLASIALARVRRTTGAAYLALHILEALGRFASPPWMPWLRLEARLAGGEPPAGAAGDPSDRLGEARRAALQGDRAAFASAAERALESVSGSRLLASELESVLAGMDLEREAADPAMRAWRLGEVDDVPRGLHAFAADGGSVGLVFLPPGGSGRRTFGVGLAPVSQRVPRPRARHRTDLALARLALAPGARMDEREFFAHVYGFDYEAALHHTTLDALVHRMRATLEPTPATLERGGGFLAIRCEAQVVLADPRCAEPLGDRLLRSLARDGACAARALATQLDVPLRTVQSAIRELTDEGMCSSVREGRVVKYYVEDTTFSEPTRSGVLVPRPVRR